MERYLIFVAAFAFFEAFIVYLFLHKLFEENDVKRIIRIGSFIVFGSGLIMINMVANGNGIVTIAYVFVSIIILSQLFFRGSIYAKLLLTFTFCILTIAAELLNMFTLNLFIDDIKKIGENGTLRIIANSISCLWLFIFIQLFSRFYRVKEQRIKGKYWLLLLSVTCISLVDVYNMAMLFYKNNRGEMIMVSIVLTIGMLYINIIIFYLFDHILEKHELEAKTNLLSKQIEHQKENYQQIYRHQEEIRRIKHDMHHHYVCIKNYLQDDNVEEAVSYLHSISKISTENGIVMSGNPIIDAMINASLNRCKEEGIISSVNIHAKSMGNIEEVDLCIVLGNALDNAVEACRQVKDKSKRFIDIRIETEQKYVVIQVENSVSNDVVKRKGIVLTKKEDKLNHGLGLGNIKVAVDKYNGEMITRNENGVFLFVAMMKYREECAGEEGY